MDLFPVHVVVAEGATRISDFFFIDPRKFSPMYFNAHITPTIAGDARQPDGACRGALRLNDALLEEVFQQIDGQMKEAIGLMNELDAAAPIKRVPLALSFIVGNVVAIEDRILFHLPIQRQPEIYAEDLFEDKGIGNSELLTLFVFYIRDEITRQLRRHLCNRDSVDTSYKHFRQMQEPVVKIFSPQINRMRFALDFDGKVCENTAGAGGLEEPQRRRRKKR